MVQNAIKNATDQTKKMDPQCERKSSANLEVSPKPERKLSLETMNPRIREVEDAVRGPMVQRAMQIEEQFLAGISKSFPNVLHANIGDPQAMGGIKPVTFIRQVIY